MIGHDGKITPYRTVISRVDLEYFAARNSTAVFDYTPMIKQRIGQRCTRVCGTFLHTKHGKIGLHRVGYAVWCDEQGQVIDDGTVFHMRENEYWLLCAERQLDNQKFQQSDLMLK